MYSAFMELCENKDFDTAIAYSTLTALFCKIELLSYIRGYFVYCPVLLVRFIRGGGFF